MLSLPRSTEYFDPPFKSASRSGTVSSAVFNLINSMVGGGVLSLPYAFYKSGIANGIVILMVVGAAADYSVYSLVSCSRRSGQSSFEGVAAHSLGTRGKNLTLFCVILTCFLAVVGYAVLLRDLLTPLAGRAFSKSFKSGCLVSNLLMGGVGALVTPLMFMGSLTSLKPVAIVSAVTIGCLALSVIIRTVQCNSDAGEVFTSPLSSSVKWFGSISDTVTSLPIYVCTYVCHFNVLPVHTELHKPTRRRLRQLVHTTFLVTFLFYAAVGSVGSLVGNCRIAGGSNDPDDDDAQTPSEEGEVSGNVLLNFSQNDNLITVGRCGLSCTITLAFPMLVIPCRDMLLRIIEPMFSGTESDSSRGGANIDKEYGRVSNASSSAFSEEAVIKKRGCGSSETAPPSDMTNPLLQTGRECDDNDDGQLHKYPSRSKDYDGEGGLQPPPPPPAGNNPSKHTFPPLRPLVASSGGDGKSSSSKPLNTPLSVAVTLLVFYGGMLIACFIESVTVVWDILGSSISILIAFVIPAAAYLSIRTLKSTRREKQAPSSHHHHHHHHQSQSHPQKPNHRADDKARSVLGLGPDMKARAPSAVGERRGGRHGISDSERNVQYATKPVPIGGGAGGGMAPPHSAIDGGEASSYESAKDDGYVVGGGVPIDRSSSPKRGGADAKGASDFDDYYTLDEESFEDAPEDAESSDDSDEEGLPHPVAARVSSGNNGNHRNGDRVGGGSGTAGGGSLGLLLNTAQGNISEDSHGSLAAPPSATGSGVGISLSKPSPFGRSRSFDGEAGWFYNTFGTNTRRAASWALLVLFIPIMILCTGNAVKNLVEGN